MDLLHVLLTLVDEKQLRRHRSPALGRIIHSASLLIVLLDCEIPECRLIIGARRSKDRVFCGVPLDGGDGAGVPVKRRDRGWVGSTGGKTEVGLATTQYVRRMRKKNLRFSRYVPEIPHFDPAFVSATEQ